MSPVRTRSPAQDFEYTFAVWGDGCTGLISNPPNKNSNPKRRRSSGVERFLGKEEVTGSIPVVGSEIKVNRVKNPKPEEVTGSPDS